jgi:predicted MFS family arabinose efflux permease
MVCDERIKGMSTAMKASPLTLSQTTSFWVAAAVVAHALWTSAAPAMTYRLYAANWGLTPTTTTAIYAVFPIVVVATMVCFGGTSDYIGRRTTILIGLFASLLGTLLFAVAPDILWIFVGRVFMGVGVGLTMGPGTAAMVEFSAAGQSKRASSIATAAQAVGFALATLVGGALVQYAPFPTRLNFWILFIILVAIFVFSWLLPRHTPRKLSETSQLKSAVIPKGLRLVFATATTAVTAGYVSGGLVLALGSQIAHDLVNSGNALINGAAIALLPLMMGSVGILGKQISNLPAIVAGGIASTISMLLLVLSVTVHALSIFLIAIATAGAGCSLLFLGGLNLIMASAQVDHRGGLLSALYVAAYLMQGVVALLAGAAATAWGLESAVELASVGIGLLSFAAIALAIIPKRPASD